MEIREIPLVCGMGKQRSFWKERFPDVPKIQTNPEPDGKAFADILDAEVAKLREKGDGYGR